ncbi:DNA (cytosine-5)-methyltransferase 1 [Dysgonomonas sp. PFB1-18]|uniref:DNA cytosine methyltransferase n=1 Tax=unclassified Dysgonomonas TaxID=2630389 RepID=UPI0024752B53|nr:MULTISPECIES: DNA cytosine methyltransferase [unclassified Dysgonomonas]MDH6307393.1 DNA (cytosine-5)-methyltransferase 1 [Dysgonomonas sp. PF1-14]MDH6337311.1 DNA (cytosine-5)-methyltransferase 1 [Dysgonomonas sp. PF1-16]MDH6379235.1 DNA (cytosine-5)-methyltransferase 1 [Dysgonomonas sp. PFB1-18]MDH6396127.1 DNA (cytosine-5)-methyltransferase 1 [Dysgonomonas sp. PF1-23]
MKKNITFGSVCSGIEVASLALTPLGFAPLWFSEIAKFPSALLKYHYPNIPNLGDMNLLPHLIRDRKIDAPFLLCGGTPCNSFSTVGYRMGLDDDRGKLSLSFTEIIDAIDEVRITEGKESCIALWENVEGVLSDKNNAFGVFLSQLIGSNEDIKVNKWTSSGIAVGEKRTAVWRALDAVSFGLPQQRKRLYVLASTHHNVVDMLLEAGEYQLPFSQKHKKNYNSIQLTKDNVTLEIFNENSNCLTASYGEKWNGNSSAYNGSLFVAENGKLRRLTPTECEKLMGLPVNYTKLPNIKSDLPRYQVIGNAWAANVIHWIGNRISMFPKSNICKELEMQDVGNTKICLLGRNMKLKNGMFLNCGTTPYNNQKNSIFAFLETNVDEKYFISTRACEGILRRKEQRGFKINKRLETLMKSYISIKNNSQSTLAQIGANIKRSRKLNRMTQKDLAQRTNLTCKYLIELEKGNQNISILNLEKIALALGLHIKDLIS